MLSVNVGSSPQGVSDVCYQARELKRLESASVSFFFFFFFLSLAVVSPPPLVLLSWQCLRGSSGVRFRELGMIAADSSSARCIS